MWRQEVLWKGYKQYLLSTNVNLEHPNILNINNKKAHKKTTEEPDKNEDDTPVETKNMDIPDKDDTSSSDH